MMWDEMSYNRYTRRDYEPDVFEQDVGESQMAAWIYDSKDLRLEDIESEEE